ncbi:MAG: hypothetical protein HY858_01780 [Candidatus Solibacter usitatus]|nr:hypothetical protein [Candidatus Solibacter usitatus]
MKLALFLLAVSASAADFRLAVAGLGGEAGYEQRFTALAAEAAKLSGAETLAGAAATSKNLRAALAGIAAQAKPDDTFTLTLIGHGTFDGLVYKFNLVGPDVSAEELASWLDRIAARQLVVVATSASGGAAGALKKQGRVVVTATKSGTEKNAVVFGRYWMDGLRDQAADTDKNDAISAAEAFNYARQKTAAFYETQKRLATEHAQLDDAALAARFAVVRIGAAQRAMNDPAKRLMLARKDEIEASIDALKLAKAATPPAEYKQKLTAFLLELARLQEALDQ